MSRPADAAASRSGLAPAWRVPLLMLGFIGLLFGTGAGLARLGWSMPEAVAGAAVLHGPLMIGGFFGVVIALERAVAIGRYWAYTAPLLAGIGALLAAFGGNVAPPLPWAALFFLAGGAVFLAASLDVLRRQRALFTVTLALGAACWPIGSALWLAGHPLPAVVPWWLAFLVLTIAGERLELSRFLPPSPGAKTAFGAILVAVVAGLAASSTRWGGIVLAVALLALSAWLFRQDIARRTVRGRALTRFIAVCLLAGYAWLAVGSVVALFAGGFVPGTRAYDAALHAVTLGFVFSMVFGHAAIILPAVLRVTLPYHGSFYLPLVLLHGSIAIRLAGDAGAGYGWTRVGGLLNAVALAVFILTMLAAVLRGRRSRARVGRRGARLTRARPEPMASATEYLRFIVTLVAVVDPFLAVPFFITFTASQRPAARARLAHTVALTVFIVLAISIFVGEALLALIGASLPSFRVGGGLVLLLMALAMLNAEVGAVRHSEAEAQELEAGDVSGVVPLAIPLLAGPGAISTTIIAAENGGVVHRLVITGCVALVCLLAWAVLSRAHRIAARISLSGMNVATRILGLLLAAMAVQIMAEGLRGLFPGLD